MNRIFQDKETVLFIEGTAGCLELKVNGLLAGKSPRGVGVVCHPHPLHGGTFDNKVCSTLVRAFREVDYITVRFNFRGVGASEGVYDEGKGERVDLMTVVDWVGQNLPDLAIALAGFSFGGAIAAAYARDYASHLQCLIMVSPALGHFGFALDDKILVPSLVIQGEADEVLPPELVYRWVEDVASNNRVTLVSSIFVKAAPTNFASIPRKFPSTEATEKPAPDATLV